MTSIVGLMA